MYDRNDSYKSKLLYLEHMYLQIYDIGIDVDIEFTKLYHTENVDIKYKIKYKNCQYDREFSICYFLVT